MNPQPRSAAPSGRPPSRSRGVATALWFAAITAAAALGWLLLVVTTAAGAMTSLKIVAWVTIALCLGTSLLARHRLKRRYRQRFPSLDDLRRHVDTDGLRTVRDRDGQDRAVRAVRRGIPGIPLADAVRLVKSL